MAAGIKRKVIRALKKVEEEIQGFAQEGRLASALSREGYAGGYSDALRDVLLLLDRNKPNTRGYWR